MVMNPRRPRRTVLGAGLAGLAGVACAPREAPLAGIVALPERSLTYAPLLLAVKAGLYQSPPLRTATWLRTGGQAVAAAVAGGDADAGALSLPDFLDAVEAGAPLVAIGAVTRRFAGQLVAAESGALDRTLDALLSGGWRAVPFGLQIGGDGTERFVRALLESFAGAARSAPAPGRPLLAADPLSGEPRFIGYRTD